MTVEKPTFFLNQLATASPDEAIEIIKKATEHPSIFVFGEFLEESIVIQLADGPHANYLNLLDLFCFGSYVDYCQKKDQFPDLSDAQIRKLKQLTIIDEAYTCRQIPYKILMDKLSISSLRELEDLIIDLMYLEAITGKLDQQRALLDVDSAIGRDVKQEEITHLHTSLTQWCERVDYVLNHLANEIKLAHVQRQEVDTHKEQLTNEAAALKIAIKSQLRKAQSDASRMDIDECLGLPELMLPDGAVFPTKSAGNSAESVNIADKDPRKKAVFRGLRHGKMFK